MNPFLGGPLWKRGKWPLKRGGRSRYVAVKYLFEHRFSVQHIMYLLTQWKSCTGNSLAQGLNRGLYVMNESQTFSPPARSPLFFFLSFSLQPTYRRAARAYPFLHGFILSCTGLSFPARVYPSLQGFILACTCLSFPAHTIRDYSDVFQ